MRAKTVRRTNSFTEGFAAPYQDQYATLALNGHRWGRAVSPSLLFSALHMALRAQPHHRSPLTRTIEFARHSHVGYFAQYFDLPMRSRSADAVHYSQEITQDVSLISTKGNY